MIVTNKHGERFSLFRSMDQQKRTVLVMGKLSPVEPVVRLAIASGNNLDLWHIMDSAAITQDDVLRYYELTKV
jgi:hypothetical protein